MLRQSLVDDNQRIVKVKGFIINSQTRQHINSNFMLDMLSTDEAASAHYPHLVKRNKRFMTLEQSDIV